MNERDAFDMGVARLCKDAGFDVDDNKALKRVLFMAPDEAKPLLKRAARVRYSRAGARLVKLADGYMQPGYPTPWQAQSWQPPQFFAPPQEGQPQGQASTEQMVPVQTRFGMAWMPMSALHDQQEQQPYGPPQDDYDETQGQQDTASKEPARPGMPPHPFSPEAREQATLQEGIKRRDEINNIAKREYGLAGGENINDWWTGRGSTTERQHQLAGKARGIGEELMAQRAQVMEQKRNKKQRAAGDVSNYLSGLWGKAKDWWNRTPGLGAMTPEQLQKYQAKEQAGQRTAQHKLLGLKGTSITPEQMDAMGRGNVSLGQSQHHINAQLRAHNVHLSEADYARLTPERIEAMAKIDPVAGPYIRQRAETARQRAALLGEARGTTQYGTFGAGRRPMTSVQPAATQRTGTAPQTTTQNTGTAAAATTAANQLKQPITMGEANRARIPGLIQGDTAWIARGTYDGQEGGAAGVWGQNDNKAQFEQYTPRPAEAAAQVAAPTTPVLPAPTAPAQPGTSIGSQPPAQEAAAAQLGTVPAGPEPSMPPSFRRQPNATTLSGPEVGQHVVGQG